jgi:hypothetical protein
VAAVNDLARAGQGKVQVGPVRASWVTVAALYGDRVVDFKGPGAVPAIHVSAGTNNHLPPDPAKFLTSPPSGMVEITEAVIFNDNSVERYYARPSDYASLRAEMARKAAEEAAREAEKRAKEEAERAERAAKAREEAERLRAQGLCSCGHQLHVGTCGVGRVYDYAPDRILPCYCFTPPA